MDEKLKNKIKKLLKLAESSNQNEAESALEKAQELMIKNKLKESDLGVNTQDLKVIEKLIFSGTNDQRLRHLMIIIAENFNCSHFYKKFKSNTNKIELWIVGFEDEIEIVQECFNFCVNIFKKNVKSLKEIYPFTSPSVLKNSYFSGFNAGLNTKFKEQIKRNNWELVIVKDKKIIDFMDNKKLKTPKKNNKMGTLNSSAFNRGLSDGKNIELNKNQIV